MKSCAFAGVLLALVCVGGVARAGDVLAYKAAPPAPTAAMPGNFYAGVSLGGRWTDTDWTTNSIGSPPSSPQFGPLDPANFDSGTARLGGYAGYMWRIAPTWAVGIEGDLAWGNSSKGFAGIPGTCCGFTSVKEGWDGSIRGRLGYLVAPAWLVYATGGVAWQGLEIDASCRTGPSSFCRSSQGDLLSSTEPGWTLGAGLEVMLRPNWLARLEYRYADYGHIDHTFFAGADRLVMSESLRTNTLLIGFAYKLNGHASVGPGR